MKALVLLEHMVDLARGTERANTPVSVMLPEGQRVVGKELTNYSSGKQKVKNFG